MSDGPSANPAFSAFEMCAESGPPSHPSMATALGEPPDTPCLPFLLYLLAHILHIFLINCVIFPVYLSD